MHASPRGRARLAASLFAALLSGVALPAAAPASAQTKSDQAEGPAPKQVALTQTTIDNLIAAQKQIRAVEMEGSKGKKAPDPKVMEAKMDGIAKKNGFASADAFADASYSVGLVLAGMDPDSGTYIGTQAELKKQIDEVKADKKMPANERKEALDELNDALKSASSEKPLPANIDLVKANASKLNEGMQQND